MDREQRRGRVFIDWSQNSDYKTTVSVYSVRAKTDDPFVSIPLTWDEVKATSRTHRHIRDLFFPPAEALARVREMGDLFAPVLTLEQTIPAELENRLHLPRAARPVAVRVPRAQTAVPEMPRSSRQGGRKLFVIHERKGEYEFGLEYEGSLFLFDIPAVPTRRSQRELATATGTRPLDYLREENRTAGHVWDLGTYELMEGNLAKGRAEIHMSGRRLAGAWLLELDPPHCTISNRGARLKKRHATRRKTAKRAK